METFKKLQAEKINTLMGPIRKLHAKRKEILAEYEDYKKANPLSYSYPFHQIKANDEAMKEAKKGVIMDCTHYASSAMCNGCLKCVYCTCECKKN